VRVEQIIGAGLSRNEIVLLHMFDTVLLYGGRKMCAVPGASLLVVARVEEVYLFDGGGTNRGVFYQVVIERSCPPSLSSYNQKVW